jgi:hypothetical protein
MLLRCTEIVPSTTRYSNISRKGRNNRGWINGAFTDCRGWVSSVGIATGYGLDGLGIESWLRRHFSRTSRPARGPTHPPVQWVPGLSWGKAVRAWCWPPTPF